MVNYVKMLITLKSVYKTFLLLKHRKTALLQGFCDIRVVVDSAHADDTCLCLYKFNTFGKEKRPQSNDHSPSLESTVNCTLTILTWPCEVSDWTLEHRFWTPTVAALVQINDSYMAV